MGNARPHGIAEGLKSAPQAREWYEAERCSRKG
jgi:hypothetical protein